MSDATEKPRTTSARWWNLGGGAVMGVAVPERLSRSEIAKLRRYVDALEAEASILWEDEPADASPSVTHTHEPK